MVEGLGKYIHSASSSVCTISMKELLVGQTGLFNLDMAAGPGEFKPVKLCLKIDLVSHPAFAEGLGKCIPPVNSRADWAP